MPIELSWLDDEKKRHMIWRIGSTFTWDEFDEADALGKKMAEGSTRPYNTIVEASSLTNVPSGLLSHFPKASDMPAHQNILIIVGVRGFVRSMAGIFGRVYKQVQFADTFEEAVKLSDKVLEGLESKGK